MMLDHKNAREAELLSRYSDGSSTVFLPLLRKLDVQLECALVLDHGLAAESCTGAGTATRRIGMIPRLH